MTENKDSSVSASSLIDLKAELYRKQEEFKREKLLSQNSSYIKGKASTTEKKKPSIWSKKNAGVNQRAAKDYETKLEEEDIFEKSKKSLESKAKLYEKITSGREVPDEDGSGLYLVDFQKKVIDGVFEERDRARQEEEEKQRREIEEERQQLLEPVPDPENEEEEWVDFVDSLGRSRRCLKKDLPDLQKQDEDLQERKRAASSAMSKDFQNLRDKSEASASSLMSDDMRRELQRQEWEKQELETMEAEKSGPIHYSDVRHNEIRTHGTGFYEFDKDETVRQEQMQELNKLREQTVTERSRKDRIKEKRKAALEARLAKVKQRRKLKTGDQDVEEESGNKSDEEIGPKLEEKAETIEDRTAEAVTENKPVEVAENKKTVPKIREWDIGKERLLERTEASWIERQRAERDREFAPPKEYYDSPRPTGHNPRPLHQQWKEGKRTSVFSKINKIKLECSVSEKAAGLSDQTAFDNSLPASEQDRVKSEIQDSEISCKNQNLHATDTNSNNCSQSMESSGAAGALSDQLPFGFNPSVPPPGVMFPQQQTSTGFMAAPFGHTALETQSTNIPYFQSAQMPCNSNENATYAGVKENSNVQNVYGSQGVGANYNMTASANYTSGPALVPHPAVSSTTLPWSNSTVSGTATEYGSLTTSYGNVGVQPPDNTASNLTAYSQVSQMAPKTEQKLVIPKMKIIDTRLMQNEGD